MYNIYPCNSRPYDIGCWDGKRYRERDEGGETDNRKKLTERDRARKRETEKQKYRERTENEREEERDGQTE